MEKLYYLNLKSKDSEGLFVSIYLKRKGTNKDKNPTKYDLRPAGLNIHIIKH